MFLKRCRGCTLLDTEIIRCLHFSSPLSRDTAVHEHEHNVVMFHVLQVMSTENFSSHLLLSVAMFHMPDVSSITVPVNWTHIDGRCVQEALEWFGRVEDMPDANGLIFPMETPVYAATAPPLTLCNNFWQPWDTKLKEHKHYHWMIVDLPLFHAMKEAIDTEEIFLDPPSAEHCQTMLHLHYLTGTDLLWNLGQVQQRLSRAEEATASLRDQLAVLQRRFGVVSEWVAAHEPTLAPALGLTLTVEDLAP